MASGNKVSDASRPDQEWLVNQIAHVLRNPIFAAMVQAGALARVATSVEGLDQPTRILLDQLRRLERTIDEMLLFGRKARIRREPVEVALMVDELARAYRDGIRIEPAEISTEHDDPSLVAEWDSAAVRTILQRVLDNAIEHTQPPHPIEVRVERCGSRHCCIAVRDRGEGIPEDIRDRVFLPFYPQHRGRPGLGLAVARKLSIALGGDIELASRQGDGTEVRIRLPLRASDDGT